MTIQEANHVYMVGIKGFGMASLATVLVKMGKRVTGSDVETDFPTKELLDALSIKPKIGFHIQNVPVDADMVITTGAHGGLHNPEVDHARSAGIPVYTHAEALGMVMDMYTNSIAVCGCHGKTTASAMCSYVMHHMGISMGYQVGTASFSGMQGGDHTGTDYFVVEADEYAASPGIDNTARFLFLNPTIALCLNIDLDHVDIYPNLDAIKNVYMKLFEKVHARGGVVVYCYDDENARDVVRRIPGLKTRSYGFSEGAQVRIQDGKVLFEDGRVLALNVGVPGRHNVLNACGVLAVLDELGLNVESGASFLPGFTGSKLRFEVLFDSPDYTVINDYAHHPVEIRATIQAARERYPNRRIISIFHPHTVSRTKEFENEFIQEITQADQAILLDIFTSAREQADGTYTSEDIVKRAVESGVSHLTYVPFSALMSHIKTMLQPGDVLLWMGAGSKENMYNDSVEHIKTL